MTTPLQSVDVTNVAIRLAEIAQRDPSGIAVVMPRGRYRATPRKYDQISFRELDDDSNLLADGLRQMGVQPGTRLILLVKPSIDFVSLVFAMFKAGVVTVLIDPGMGRKNLVSCLAEVRPQGFVAIPFAQTMRLLLRKRFPEARLNVTVGRRWFWGGVTIAELRKRTLSPDFQPVQSKFHDPAAIIFTTGSTGPPKGVLYSHGNFDRQVEEIRDHYGIEPGGVDLAGFPLFGLFNSAMGVTTVIPDMDATRPADVDPRNILQAVHDWRVTQSFASPALWNTVGRYCEKNNASLPTLRRVLSAGAPVPPHVLQRVKNVIHPDGEIYTPYGATEALPVASNSAREILGETAPQSDRGAGTCVGGKMSGIQWKVIQITDEPLLSMDEVTVLPQGEIGELIVRGKVVTRQYITRVEANALHKIQDGDDVWHRMGDVGYFDEQDRFWFCGRKAHRLLTSGGIMFTIPCESIMNTHERIYRSALVGVGPAPRQRPVIIVEPWPDQYPRNRAEAAALIEELRALAASNALTQPIRDFLLHRSLPVDIRHNAKIFREQLRDWAGRRLGAVTDDQ